MAATLQGDLARVCDLLRARRRPGGRTMVGIAGPPASGKSTLAQSVVDALNAGGQGAVPEATLLPMDGYHLDNSLLEARGLLARKGAPETFNAEGFCAAVARVATAKREMFFPRFDRQADLSVAQSIAIHPETPVVVVEGNYLLLSTPPWSALGVILDVSVFLSPALDLIEERLVQRWLSHGLSADAALRRARENDLPNAELVLGNSRKADLVLEQDAPDHEVRVAL